jgi:hypothetical protein
MLSIPGLTKTQPLPKGVLESRLKVVDQRRAVLETMLAQVSGEPDYRHQELQAELVALNSLRTEITDILSPRPLAPRHPVLEKQYQEDRERSKVMLRNSIKQQTEQLIWNAEQEATAGNHRQSKLLMLMVPEVGEQVCREMGLPLELLAELEL